MTVQTLTVSADWPATPHFTANIETAALIVNPNKRDNTGMTWIITEDDNVPVLNPALGVPLNAGSTSAVTLKIGERIWVAAPSAGILSLTATLMTGAA